MLGTSAHQKQPGEYFNFPYQIVRIARLAVHLPREESVFFQPGQDENALIRVAMKDTTLHTSN